MLNGAINIPQPVYRSLPWIYVVVGALVMLSIESFIGFVSGLLMVSAGVLVFLWRAAARSSESSLRAGQREVVRTGRLDVD